MGVSSFLPHHAPPSPATIYYYHLLIITPLKKNVSVSKSEFEINPAVMNMITFNLFNF